ncbi:MAG: hypothetical protein Q4D62_03240 [Planctomycetia bacterium]|nr:hypothetical protein [Planctomycetia bacterium]
MSTWFFWKEAWFQGPRRLSHHDRKAVSFQRLIRRKETLLRQLRILYQRHRFQVAELEKTILQKEISLPKCSEQNDLLQKELDLLLQHRRKLEEEKKELLHHFRRLQISLAKLQIYTQYWETHLSEEKT